MHDEWLDAGYSALPRAASLTAADLSCRIPSMGSGSAGGFDWKVFADRASSAAQRALRCLAGGDTWAASVDAGVSLELALKAWLVHHHPAFIVSSAPKDFDSLYFAVTGVALQGRRPRTITCKEALARVVSMSPKLNAITHKLQTINELRNGALHAAEERDIHDLMGAWAKALDSLIGDLGVARSEFWGPGNVELVDNLVAESMSAVEARVGAKLAVAKERFRELIVGLVPTQQASLIGALASRSPAGAGEIEVECPACGSPAVVEIVEDVEVDADYEAGDFGEVIAVPYQYAVAFPGELRCPVCSLQLSDPDELAVVGIDDSLIEEDAPEPFDDDGRY